MKSLFLILAVSLAVIGCGKKAALNESVVLETIDEISSLYLDGKVAEMMEYYADDLKLTISGEGMGGEQVLTKEMYQELLRQVVEGPMTYTMEMQDVEVSISTDGSSATANYITVEDMTFQGQSIKSKSKQKVIFEVVEERPVVTSAEIAAF